MASVELRRLKKSFGAFPVVDGIDLSIKDREFVVLVGPSGCGKSTTLRMIAGLESITAGQVLIGDTVVNALAPRERDIAMVFQDYALYPHKSVRENLGFSLKVRRIDPQEGDKRIQEASEMLGIAELLERKPSQLSGGQRQRFAMGRAIVRRPKVFLFDEPLSNLDAKLRGQVRTEIKRLHQTIGTTIVYVTHDQVEAMTLADRIVILRNGSIEQVGTPDEVYNKPASVFVAGFVGSPAMNFVTVRRNGSQLIFDSGDTLPLHALARQESAYDSKDSLVIGVRPEHFFAPGDAAHRLSGHVQVVEPLGSDTLIHMTVGASQLTARVPPEFRPKVGETIPLGIDPQRLHVFDPQSECAIA